jgi:DnaK suppressor protein
MTKTQTAKVRSQLEKERKRLQTELEQLTKSGLPDPDGGRSPSQIDSEASESLEFEKRMVIGNRLKAALWEIERALEKVDLGTYGLCEKCKKAINPARLEALPQASLCLDCKQQSRPERRPTGVNAYLNEAMPFYDSLNN